MSSRYLHHRCPRLAAFPLSSLSSPLRERQTRVLPSWSGYIATRYVESSEYILIRSRCSSCTSPLRNAYIHSSTILASFVPQKPDSLCLPPPSPLFSISLPVFTLHITRPSFLLPSFLDLATQIGEVSTLLHEITSLPLDFTSGENMPVRDRLVIFVPAHALASFPLVFAIAVFSSLLSVLI